MNKIFKTVFLLAFTAVLILVVLNYLGYFSVSHEIYEAEIGELKYEIENKGYLMYEEDIIGAPFDGEITYLVNNNQRVTGKTPVAKIKRKDLDIDRELTFDGKDLLIDINKLKNSIKTLENQIAFFRKEKDVEAEEKAKKVLENLYPVLSSLDNRNDLYYNKPKINFKKDEETGDILIYSDNSGIVSLKAIPYDQIFTPKNMYILRYNKMKDYGTPEVKKDVLAKEGFMRIVNNSQVFLMTNIDKEESAIFKKNKRIDIEINNTVVKAILTNKINNSDDVTLQFLLMNDFNNLVERKIVNIKLIPAKEEGIIIDEDSIIDYNGEEGVEVLNKDNSIVFKRINRLTTVNGKVCISVDSFNYFDKDKNIVNVRTVKLYDDILKNPKEEYLIEK